VASYARDVFTTAPADLLPELTADLELLWHRAASATDRTAAALAIPAARLGVVMALTLAGLGRTREARRWWRTARDTADQTGDPRTSLLVRGWEAVSGLYEHRPPAELLGITDEALALTAHRDCAAAAGVLAGRAQVLALLRRDADARQTLQDLAAVTAALPSDVLGDETSMFGWPEYRLRHTESYVYTAIDDYPAAYAAQDQAFDLYPPELRREHAMVQLHRAACLVGEGEVNGLGYAMRVLIELPDHCHDEVLYDVAGRVLTAVRPGDLGRPVVRDYRDLLVTRPHLRR
jgi:tetratricopeptide (TPR) repeat protein